MKVLIAEDDPHIRQGLAEILESEGYRPILARDGLEALALFEQEAPDFVCLDILMPACNGYDVCRALRQRSAQVPIIFISAKAEEIDKVIGLELGADDFIVKPFGVKEVAARIRAVTRRCLAAREGRGQPGAAARTFRLLDLEVFPAELRAKRGTLGIDLSLRDVKILELFHRHPGEVLDRNTLYNHAWGENFFPDSRALDQYISQLRRRVEADPSHPSIIRTIHGAGYRYEA